MANWENLNTRGEVDDRRGMTTVAAGGIGLAGIALVVILNLLGGGDIDSTLNQLQNVLQEQIQTQNSEEFAGNDSYEVFASTVLGSANDMWKEVFAEQNKIYTAPKLILFRSATQSGCGIASSEVGPHYCPLDNSIYLDETFFNELETRLGAKGGDVAEAYVIAHEVGHHAQNLLGRLNSSNTNEDSVRIELQADCYAGLWANYIKDKNVFEVNEINEAIDAAEAVGDDRIQSKTQGQINPETWTHGSSAQRVQWFNTGYDTGSFSQCNP